MKLLVEQPCKARTLCFLLVAEDTWDAHEASKSKQHKSFPHRPPSQQKQETGFEKV